MVVKNEIAIYVQDLRAFWIGTGDLIFSRTVTPLQIMMRHFLKFLLTFSTRTIGKLFCFRYTQ